MLVVDAPHAASGGAVARPGEITPAGHDAGASTYAYDAAGNLISVQEPFGLTLSYQYDAAGNVVQETDSLGGVTTSTYDANGNLTSQLYQGQGATLLIQQDWNADGQLVEVRRYSDAAGADLVGTTDYTYDADGNLTGITATDASGTVIQQFQYVYDADGQLTSEVDNGTTTNYAYNTTGELTDAGANSYSYDANGNRTMSGYTVGADNLLESDGTWNYTYDADNNLVEKVNIATGDTWTYTYDNLNHLTGAEELDASGNVLASVSYVYDVNGNLLEEETTTAGMTTVQRFGYDGTNAWLALDGSDNLVDRRVFDDAGNLAAIVSAGGSVQWLLADHLGSVRAVTDSSGSVIASTDYDAYGNASNLSALAYSDNYGYAGYVYDATVGLYRAEYRFYDPTTGSWTTQDPLGFGGGDANTTRYVANDPTGATDPTGEKLVASGPVTDEWMSWLSQKGIQASAIALPKEHLWSDRTWYIHIPDNQTGAFRNLMQQYGAWGAAIAEAGAPEKAGVPTNLMLLPNWGYQNTTLTQDQDVAAINYGLSQNGETNLLSTDGPYLAWEVAKAAHEGYEQGKRNVVVGTAKIVKETALSTLDSGNDTLAYLTGERVGYKGHYSDTGNALQSGQLTAEEFYQDTALNMGTLGVYGEVQTLKNYYEGKLTADEASERLGAAGVSQLVMAKALSKSPTANKPISQLLRDFINDERGSVSLPRGQSAAPKNVPRPNVNTGLPNRVTQELPTGQTRTPAEVAQARNFFERNRAAAKQWWEQRTSKDWPADATHAEHPRPLVDGGDPLFIEPGFGGPNAPHMVPGPDGLTDFQRWGQRGGRPPKQN